MVEEWVRFRQGNTETGIVKVKLDEARISAQVGPLGSVLTFPLEWEWNQEWQEKLLYWEIILVTGQLLWNGAQRQGASLTPSLPMYSLNQSPASEIRFPFTLTQLEEVEEYRDGSDAKFNVRIICVTQLIARINMQRVKGPSISTCVIGTYPIQSDLFVTIPKSRYEEDLLAHMGINGLASVTIVFPTGIRGVFAAPLYELQRAEKTLRTASTEEQFESVVLQCRNAIDSLLNQFHFQLPNRADGKPDASFHARVDALGVQFLSNVLSGSQVQSVCSILHGLWEPYSGATKPGHPHHSRAYANFALEQAASVVKLISEALWNKQRALSTQ